MMRGVEGYQTGTNEPPLILLVERYLADNSNLSYINIENMADFFQASFFRFKRLPRKVFTNQVRSAYYDYCRRNGRVNNARPNVGVEERPAPQSFSDNKISGSDVEELDDRSLYNPRKDLINSSLTTMYKNSPSNSLPKSPKSKPFTKNARTNVTDDGNDDLLSRPFSSANIIGNIAAPHVDDDDSDDDLQIVDEVQGTSATHQHASFTPQDSPHIKLAQNISSRISVTVLPQDECNNLNVSPRGDRVLKKLNINPSFNPPLSTQLNNTSVPSPSVSSTTDKGNENGSEKEMASENVTVTGKRIRDTSHSDNENSNRGLKRKNMQTQSSDGITQDLKSKKLKKKVDIVSNSQKRLADFGGNEKVVEEVCKMLMHLRHPEVYTKLGVTAPRGFLLHGAPGTGKTLLANAIAGELQLPMLKVTGTEFVSGISGESESNIRDLFKQAVEIAPCIIFIDEIDSITPKRENAQREMERRIVAQLLSCVDELMGHEKGAQVLLIGATNRVEAIDTALRRAGRFDKEICLGIPDEKSRKKILEVICKGIRLDHGFDLDALAKLTPGYVGADLQMLVREAAVQAVNKTLLKAGEKVIPVKSNEGNKIDMKSTDEVHPVIVEAHRVQTTGDATLSANCQNHEVEIVEDNDDITVIEHVKNDTVLLGTDSLITVQSGDRTEVATCIGIEENMEVDENADVQHANVEQSATPGSTASGLETILEKSEKSEKLPPSVTLSVEEVCVSDMIIGDLVVQDSEAKENSVPIILLKESTCSEDDIQVESDLPIIVSTTGAYAADAFKTVSPENHKSCYEVSEIKTTDLESKSTTEDTAKSEPRRLANQNKLGESSARANEVPVILVDDSCNNFKIDDTEPSYLKWIKESAPLSEIELAGLYISIDDFLVALKHVQPSSKREGFATVPDTTWDDIGALADIREELEGPVKYSNVFQSLGLNTPAGVLLCGPPGCGKTLVAKAVANEAGINFISVKGPELLNMYVGESERAVRQCFIRAKNSSPCVIFFDEIDALCPRRSDGPESGSGSRIVNQLLTEMDGVEGREGVFIMAATNRPDILDPAILRPGRLDKVLFIDLPSSPDRYEILKAVTKNGTKPALAPDVDLKSIADRDSCEFYTGADLAALVREASIAAFKELVFGKSNDGAPSKDLKVSLRHFETAFLKTKPSVSRKDREKYAEMKVRYSCSENSGR